MISPKYHQLGKHSIRKTSVEKTICKKWTHTNEHVLHIKSHRSHLNVYHVTRAVQTSNIIKGKANSHQINKRTVLVHKTSTCLFFPKFNYPFMKYKSYPSWPMNEYNWVFLMFVLCFCNEGINKILKNMAQKNNLMKKGV